MKYFKLSEFDCKSEIGSGKNMDIDFLKMIDQARAYAGTAFVVNSGFRTKSYNEDLIRRGFQASPVSSHMKGKAADIHTNLVTRMIIIDACIRAGFKRIGVANTFIHVDNDNMKKTPAVWLYGNVNPAIRAVILAKL